MVRVQPGELRKPRCPQKQKGPRMERPSCYPELLPVTVGSVGPVLLLGASEVELDLVPAQRVAGVVDLSRRPSPSEARRPRDAGTQLTPWPAHLKVAGCRAWSHSR